MSITLDADITHQSSLFNAKPILNEIRHGLDRLLDDGHPTVIDLQRVPFTVEDERYLQDALGAGEVHATINALGQSIVQEAGIAGVWWVTHYDESGNVVGKYIEVTKVPEVLKSQHQDIARGLRKLSADPGVDQPTTIPGSNNGQAKYPR